MEKRLTHYREHLAFLQVYLTSRFDKDGLWAGVWWHGTAGLSVGLNCSGESRLASEVLRR